MAGASGQRPAHRALAPGAEAAAATRSVPSASTCRSPADKPPALHDTDGWIDFGAGGRLVLLLADRDDRDGHADARRPDADGRRATAWFDHQWGDFISVGGGGWDWFAVNLDDGTDLTLSLVRDADGTLPARLRDARRRRTARPGTSTGTRSRSTSTGPLDEPGDRRRLPGRLARPDPGRGPRRSTSRRRSPTRSSTRGRRPASSTGRARRSSRATRDGTAARRRGLRRAHRLRLGQVAHARRRRDPSGAPPGS